MTKLSLLFLSLLAFTASLLAGDFKEFVFKGNANAMGVNAAGHVVGMQSGQAYLWTRSGGYQVLGDLGGGLSSAAAVNDGDVVVGYSKLPNGATHAFRWTSSGGMQDLGSPLGGNSYASAVNANGEVTGTTVSPDVSTTHVFYWSQSTGTVDIGALPGDSSSVLPVLNNSGEIAGISEGASPRAFSWTFSGGMHALAGFGGSRSAANSINDAGQIAGFSTYADGTQHAALWAAHGSVQDLGSLPGDTFSTALFVNAAGHVAGTSSHGTGHNMSESATFFWTADLGMEVVSQRYNGHGYAACLNNHDQIIGHDRLTYFWSQPIGYDQIATGRLHAFQCNDAAQALAYQPQGGTEVFKLLTPVMNVGLSSSQNPSQSGQSVTFSATLKSVVGPPPDGEQVKFFDGRKVLGTGTLASGVATFTTSSLSAGTHTIKAEYVGDSNYASSKSGALSQVVNP